MHRYLFWELGPKIINRVSISKSKWLPICIAILVSTCILIGTAFTWNAFKHEDDQVIDAAFNEQQSLVRAKVNQHINQAVIAVGWMADRWEAQGGIDYELWQKDAANYVADFSALKALGVTGPDLRIKWMEPLQGNESAKNLYIAFEKKREEALLKAIELKKATITPPVDLVQGYKALIIHTPTYIEGHFSGFINAIYDPLLFLDRQLSKDFSDNFHMTLKDGDNLIFETEGASDYLSKKQSITKFNLLEREWTLTLKAKGNFVKDNRSYYGTISLIVGSLAAVLLGILTYTAITSQQKNNLLKLQTRQLIKKEKDTDKLLEELAMSNEELARFAYVCSHDLQEPLRMVQSFSQKLQAHLGGSLKDDERGQLYFKFVIDGAKRSQILIKDILAYSEIDRDAHQLEVVDLNELVEILKINLGTSIEDSKGRIDYGPLPHVEGNKTQIYQLMQNLINNGLKYQEAGRSPHIDISSKDLGSHWEISVKDNGIGISSKYQDKIFEVFQRLHRRTEYAGTGIGLAICKKVVERHEGTIRVTSETGKGSTFIFTLPKINSRALAA